MGKLCRQRQATSLHATPFLKWAVFQRSEGMASIMESSEYKFALGWFMVGVLLTAVFVSVQGSVFGTVQRLGLTIFEVSTLLGAIFHSIQDLVTKTHVGGRQQRFGFLRHSIRELCHRADQFQALDGSSRMVPSCKDSLLDESTLKNGECMVQCIDCGLAPILRCMYPNFPTSQSMYDRARHG